ncbi:MAG: hypothetical protein U0271_45355 [Polyangiaceae bacterium]
MCPWTIAVRVAADVLDGIQLIELPAPLDAEGRAQLMARLTSEQPRHVCRILTTASTIETGDSVDWQVLVLRFADGLEVVVAGLTNPSEVNPCTSLLSALEPRHLGRFRDPIDREVELGVNGMVVWVALQIMVLWAIALGLVFGLIASLVALLPLPTALCLSNLVRRSATHVVPDAV